METVQPVKTLCLAAALAASFLASGLHAVPARAETATGYAVLDLRDGQVLAEKNPRRAFIPASVMKVPTALAVLEALGPDHRFTTRLVHTGTVAGGILAGDLVLVGGGDPTLDTPALEAMAQALAAAGITQVAGRFLYDEGALPGRPMIEDRQPPDASYNPGLGGLSLDFNRFKVLWNAGNPTGAEIPLDPLPVALSGTPALNEVWLPVREPGRFTARVFQWLAGRHGVALPLPEPGAAPAGEAAEVARRDSGPLPDILRQAMIYSNNMTMETLALAAAGATLGRPVPLEEAGAWLAERTKAGTPGADWTAFAMPNASGLTDGARMTPRQCAALALRMAKAEIAGVATADLLPPLLLHPFAAADQRPGGTPALRAKTGTISYARGLAGTLRTKAGRDVAFCIMTDDQEQRAAYDAVPFDQRRDDTVRRPAREWLRAAREVEEVTVTGWYQRL